MTDNTEAMELWREAEDAARVHGPQAAAAIIASKLAELRARIEGLRNRLTHISDNSEDGSSRLEADIALDDDDAAARQSLEADHGA